MESQGNKAIVLEQQALPGFEDFVVGAAKARDRPGAVDLQNYTAEGLIRDYPGTFKQVVRALFYYHLPNRVVRDLFRLNGKVVKAIKEMSVAQLSGTLGGAFLCQNKAQSQRDIIICRLADALEEKLEDDNVIKSMSVGEIIDYMERLQGAKKDGAKPNTIPTQTKDITIIEGEYEDVVNGLFGEGKAGEREREDGIEGEKEGERGRDTV